MSSYIPLESEKYYESILSKIEKVLLNYNKKNKFILRIIIFGFKGLTWTKPKQMYIHCNRYFLNTRNNNAFLTALFWSL